MAFLVFASEIDMLDLRSIRWIVIYPVGGVIHLSNNPGMSYKSWSWTGFFLTAQ